MPSVALINPPASSKVARDYLCGHTSKGNYYWPAIDLLVLSGLAHDNVELCVIDAVVDLLDCEEVLRRIESFTPDIVVSLTSHLSWDEDKKFFSQINSPLYLLGDKVTACPNDVLSESWIEGIITDFTSPNLPAYFKDNLEGTFAYGVPRYDLFDLAKYSHPMSLSKRSAVVISDYGCKFNCGFCFFENVSHRTRSLEDLKCELDYLHRVGIKELFFNDACFGGSKGRAVKICEILNEYSPKFDWICSTRAEYLDVDLVQKMKEAGCHLVSVGVESGDRDVTISQNKNTKTTTIQNSFDLLSQFGIDSLAHIIIGLPGESWNSFNKTLKLLKVIDPSYASINIATPLPNSSFRKLIEDSGGILESVPLDISSTVPAFEYVQLSAKDMSKMRSMAIRQFYLRPNYILRRLINVRSINQLKNLITEGTSLLISLLRN